VKKPKPHMLESFVCVQMATCKLTRVSCARMYQYANGRAKFGEGQFVTFAKDHCRGCEVGAAHARGELHPLAPTVPVSAVIARVRPLEGELEAAAAARNVRRIS